MLGKLTYKPLTLFHILTYMVIIFPTYGQGIQEQCSSRLIQMQAEIVSNSNIDNFFSSDAIVLNTSGKTLENEDDIIHQIKGFQKLSNVFFTTGREIRNIYYSIYEFSNNTGESQLNLIIWQIENEIPYIDFMYSAPITEENTLTLEKIDLARELWIKLCNENNASKLISQVYTPNTIYYNHKPLIIGREALIKEYAYMNREEYNLRLNPLFVKRANDDIAFEIGQCVGSYGGKYILIWKKTENDEWQIFIDSNI